MNAVAIRPGVPADAAALARLFRASRAAAMPWLPVLYTPEEDLAWMRGRVLTGCEVRVAWAGDVPAGFVARAGEWIEHLYLAPEMRRRGIGTALLAAVTADDPPLLRLHAFARNAAARAFYEAHGFVAVAQSDGSSNEEGEPDLLYERRRGAPHTEGEPSP
ncbi:GNAT family N-acetyltransferase [Roseomonas sp. CCTCC AB2023176]|uniref:GNAT family N-acetyltransferase n=1 Tax=Roseomonas sp. CCTCC AB2023176 TaxID=3342640 RepID=UPI0035E2726A